MLTLAENLRKHIESKLKTTSLAIMNKIDYNNNNSSSSSKAETTTALLKKVVAGNDELAMSRQLLSKLKLSNGVEAERREQATATMTTTTTASVGPRNEWNIDSSQFAKSTLNPVRKMIEQMKLEPNPDLPMIALSIGDPTIFSDLGKPDTAIEAIETCIKDKRYDGYTPSYGTETARTAVAKYCSRPDNLVYKSTDIILTNGCSHAIDLCITVLANRGQNVIIPKPGFSIYKTLCGTLGINVKYYSLIVSHVFFFVGFYFIVFYIHSISFLNRFSPWHQVLFCCIFSYLVTFRVVCICVIHMCP